MNNLFLRVKQNATDTRNSSTQGKAGLLSPIGLLIRIAVAVFSAELLIMVAFIFLPPFSDLVEALLDSTTLVILVSPALYFFAFRPLTKLVSEYQQTNEELKQLQTDLEQRVSERTQALAVVTEVGAATATILETRHLLQEVVDLTKERFDLYHSHIYLFDEDGKNLILTAGSGEPGRIMSVEKHSIPLDREQSLVARAARERKGVIVNDVTQAPDFLPNPFLPNTRSELAVPMIVGGDVIGVFDVQSDKIGRFTESDINTQTTLAAQLATSVQNARSFEGAREQARLETMVNLIGQKIQRAVSMEDALQTAIRELGQALGAPRVQANIQANRQDGGDSVALN